MKRNDWIFLLSVILYSLLFYKQMSGLNFLIFNAVLVTGTAFIHKEALKSRNWWFAALGAVFTAGCVFWYGNTLSIIANFISLLILGTLSMHTRGSVLVSMFLTICSVASSYVYMVLDGLERRQRNVDAGKVSNRSAARFLILLVVLVVVLIFFFMYRSSNVLFYEFTKNINLDFISGGWIVFTLIGAFVVYGFYYHHSIPGMAKWDESHALTLQPKPAEPVTGLDKLMSLVNERYSGVLLLGLLNLLLFFVNGVDIAFMMGDKKLPEGVSFTEYLHQGVGMLITSIIFAMLIILYYFRGRLNFDGKNNTLRALAMLWIAQNAFMLVSTAMRNEGYVMEYGLTYKRIGVFVYLLLTLIGLTTVAVKVLRKKTNAYLFRANAWLFYAVLAISPSVNWDRIITQYNLQFPSNPDISYLTDLSYANFEELAMMNRMGLMPAEVNGFDDWDRGYRVGYSGKFYREVYRFMYRQRLCSWQSFCMNKRMVYEKLLTQSIGKDTALEVNYCELDALPYFKAFESVTEIHAAGNRLKKLDDIKNFKQLRELFLTNNELDSLNDIAGLDKLELLDVRGNDIKDFSPLYNLRSLKTLYLTTSDYGTIDKLKAHNPQLEIVNNDRSEQE